MSVNITGSIGQSDKLQFDNSGNLKVVSSGGGGGIANLQVRDAANTWTDVGYFAGDQNVPVTVQNSTLAVTQSGAWSTGRTWVLSSINDSVTVSGTVIANQGGTWNIGTLTSITNNVNIVGTQSDNSANSTAKLPVISARANAAVQTWTEGNQVPLSVDLSGNLRTIGSGNYTVVQNTGSNLHIVVDSGSITSSVTGTVTANQGGAPWSENITQFGGNAIVTGTGISGLGIPRVTVANDSNILATQSGTWNINTLTSITNAIITNADTTIGGTVAPSKLLLVGGKTTDITPQYQPLPLNNGGAAVKVDGSSYTQPVSWSVQTVTVTQSTGTNLHMVLDSGTLTTITNPVTVSQPTAANLNATVTGTITANQGGTWTTTVTQSVGTNLHSVVDSGTITSNQGTPTTAVNAWPIKFTDGVNLITAGDNTNNAVRVNVVTGGSLADTQVRNSSNVWTDVGYATGDLSMPVQGTVADDTRNNTIGSAKLPTLPAVANSFQGSGFGTDGYAVPLNVDRDGALRVTGDDFKTMNQLLFMVLNELIKLNKNLMPLSDNGIIH